LAASSSPDDMGVKSKPALDREDVVDADAILEALVETARLDEDPMVATKTKQRGRRLRMNPLTRQLRIQGGAGEGTTAGRAAAESIDNGK
jgi:hypothetical protein